MKYRSLGKSGIEASVVGVGAWAIGGWMWGGADEAEAREKKWGLWSMTNAIPPWDFRRGRR